MPTQLLRSARGLVTQGSADAFAQAEIQTGLNAQALNGWLIKSFSWVWGIPANMMAIATDFSYSCVLTKATKTALVAWDDADCLYFDGLVSALTTSGVGVWAQNHTHYFAADGILHVLPTIYAGIDSNGTGLASSMYWRMEYEVVKLSEVDFLTMLAVG